VDEEQQTKSLDFKVNIYQGRFKCNVFIPLEIGVNGIFHPKQKLKLLWMIAKDQTSNTELRKVQGNFFQLSIAVMIFVGNGDHSRSINTNHIKL
jgi:hypothetical protein